MKTLALLIGVILLAIGIAGFIPALNPDGGLLGLMPMDTVRSVLFIVTGLVGIGIGLANRRSLPPPPSGNGDMRFWM